MAINHEMNYYNYGKTLDCQGVMPVYGGGVNPEPKHEYVDLGLPSGLKWATFNIGASTPEEYGLYFAWGETSGYTADYVGIDKDFTWEDYKFGVYNPNAFWVMTKYNDNDGLTTLESEDDAATANWGSDWRMPTRDDFDELYQHTDVEWKNNGILLTSRENGKSLFLPCVGMAREGVLYDGKDADTEGWYWSSFLTENVETDAFSFAFGGGFHGSDYTYYRGYGCAVRPVFSQNL